MTSIQPILKLNFTSFKLNNNFCEMNIKKVTFGGGQWELLLLLKKKGSSARLGESDIHPISSKTPAIDRKKGKGRKGGIVLISVWNCNYKYLLGYPSILLGYPSNIHTCISSIGSWCVISLTQCLTYLWPPFPNTYTQRTV